MPEQLDQPTAGGTLADRLRDIPGLVALVDEAESTWRGRAVAAGLTGEESGKPGWRAFEDSFPTFYEFTNRPR